MQFADHPYPVDLDAVGVLDQPEFDCDGFDLTGPTFEPWADPELHRLLPELGRPRRGIRHLRLTGMRIA